ncbi:unnamed protein product, partial [Laminaria digitata]
ASGGGANGGSSGGGGGGGGGRGGPTSIVGVTGGSGTGRGRLPRGGVSRRSPNLGAATGAGAAPVPRRPPLLLSWEGLRYSVALPRASRWIGGGGGSGGGGGGGGEVTDNGSMRNNPTTGTGSKGHHHDHLLILDGVSGFAAGRPLVSAASPSVAHEHVEVEEEEGGEGWAAGTVTAIMGPSGAGKTSLLNALAGRLQAVSTRAGGGGLTGSVRLDGQAVGAEQVRRVSAYVTQEDVLPETLTCYEHLMFHAHLRLPAGTPLKRRHCRVMEVLQHLGLGEIWDSRIGGGLTRGVSGGEKRRLSIATEILTRPALLFLDEPTTGLGKNIRPKLVIH